MSDEVKVVRGFTTREDDEDFHSGKPHWPEESHALLIKGTVEEFARDVVRILTEVRIEHESRGQALSARDEIETALHRMIGDETT